MPGPVRVANRADAGPLSASLARAFFDDPVMSFLVPHEPTRRQHVAQYFEVALTINTSLTARPTPTPTGPAAPCGIRRDTGS